jgi:hypothetical protein
MSRKKKNPNSPATKLPKLTIGSRVRCTDDGIQGRIVWANAVAVKIRWDDGEQVTWRREALASKPIAILAEGSEDQVCSAAAMALSPQTEANERPQVAATAEQELPSAEQPAVEPAAASAAIEPAPAQQCAQSASAEATAVTEASALKQTPAQDRYAEQASPPETTQQTLTSAEQAAGQADAHGAVAKLPQRRQPKAAADSTRTRLSAVDAAAKVLGETGQAQSCPELIALMAAKGYWTSPGGKTPQATLCSALLRDIAAKGPNSRFVKSQRGKFARSDAD